MNRFWQIVAVTKITLLISAPIVRWSYCQVMKGYFYTQFGVHNRRYFYTFLKSPPRPFPPANRPAPSMPFVTSSLLPSHSCLKASCKDNPC